MDTSTKTNQGLKVALIVGILLISSAVFYYFVVFLPQQSRQQLEEKLQQQSFNTYQQLSNQQALNDCLKQVDNKVASLPTPAYASASDVQVLLNVIKQLKEECYKKYPTQ